MIVGVPREVKVNEARVAVTPAGAHLLRSDGHAVLVERGAGVGSGFSDEEYARAGATLVDAAKEVFARSELIVKVKEPQPSELALLEPRHIFFGYLHLAADRDLTEGCLRRGFTGLAYETLRAPDGSLPLLVPMSAVAGRLSIQSGATFLEKPRGGSGVLLGGVPGVLPARVLVLGGGVVGTHAAQMAAGLGAEVVVADVNLARLERLAVELPANVRTLFSDPFALEAEFRRADLVIGAVLLPGRRAPRLIERSHLALMKPGSVLVDVCIDQGGCAETSRPTTHAEPTYVEEGIVHYCVTNMPGAVPQTSTRALTAATLPYVRALARLGVDGFLAQSKGHREALNLRGGQLENDDVASAFPELDAPLSVAS